MPEENEKRRPLKPQCSFLDHYNTYLMGRSEFNFANQNSLLETKSFLKVEYHINIISISTVIYDSYSQQRGDHNHLLLFWS
jgi:hypothetical protein